MRVHPLFISGLSFCVAAVCLLSPLVSRASDLQSSSLTITALPGTTGMFEEYITNIVNATGDTATAFSLTLTATATTATGLTFTGVSTATTPDGYIFLGNSSVTMSKPFSSNAFPNLSFTAADTDTNSAGVTLVGGTRYALVEVTYAVAANATAGVYTITPSITLTGSGSLGVAPVSGTLTILPAPEPSTWAMLAGGLLLGGIALRQRAAR